MPTFTLKSIDAIKGQQLFFELVIDGTGQFERFGGDLVDTTYLAEYRTLLAYMDFVSNLKSLPKAKFRDITPKNGNVKEYEFKSKHLRCYCFKTSRGKIVALCGFKKDQARDLVAFRLLKKQFLNSER